MYCQSKEILLILLLSPTNKIIIRLLDCIITYVLNYNDKFFEFLNFE